MNLKETVQILKKGGVVAFPTETFYGLGAIPTHADAVEQIFKIKERDRGKPIMIILSSERELSRWVTGVNGKAKALIHHFWPGPLTLIFKAKKSVPAVLTAGTGKLAVRVSSEKLARDLARQIGGAITATSANLSGQNPALTALSAQRKLGKRVNGVFSKRKLSKSKGSTILDVSGKEVKVIREGMIPTAQINRILQYTHPERTKR